MATSAFAAAAELAPHTPPAPPLPSGDLGHFDPRIMEKRKTLGGWLFERFLSYPQRCMAVMRYFRRVVRLPGWYFVLRQDDVREVLSHDAEFPVAWSVRMESLTNGENFVLGMRKNSCYYRSHGQLTQAFPIEDVAHEIGDAAAVLAERIVAKAHDDNPKRLDGVEDLVLAVPAALCRSYLGVEVAEGSEALFAKWTLAISSYVFGPNDDEERTQLGLAGAARLSAAIRAGIKSAQAGKATGKAMENLLALQRAQGLTDDTLHAHLFGMVLGFIPTDVLAGGNMLETLLRNPSFMERTRAAAIANDDVLLWKCLRETLRFRHINPGAWRVSAVDYTLGAMKGREGQLFSFGDGPYTIPAGKRVLALIQSAMFDERRVPRPHTFDPERPADNYMVFGVGQHWCIGAYIAQAQITQTLKPLLQKKGLRAVKPPATVVRYNDLFPLKLPVEFDS